MQAWFISDIHLKSINERNGVSLLRFLHSLAVPEKLPTHLFLVGDIFDVWIGDSDVFYRKFKEIIDAIVALKKAGVEVVYFEGNHDVHVKKFWQRFEIPVWTEDQYFKLGKWTVRVEHGDLINSKDFKYLKYRDFIRQPRLESLAYRLSGHFWSWLGERASKKSRVYSGRKRVSQEVELREVIRFHAEKSFAEQPFDYIITGHMHIRDEYQFKNSNGVAQSVNLGSWLDQPIALRLNDEGHSWQAVD